MIDNHQNNKNQKDGSYFINGKRRAIVIFITITLIFGNSAFIWSQYNINVSAAGYLSSDNFNDNNLDPAWSKTVNTGIDIREQNGRLERVRTTGGSGWVYADLDKSIGPSVSSIKIDVDWDISRMGQLQLLGLTNANEAAWRIQFRDAWSSSYSNAAVGIKAYSSTGTELPGSFYTGYNGINSNTENVQFLVTYDPSNPSTITLTISGTESYTRTFSGVRDFSKVRINIGLQTSYYSSSDHIYLDNYQEEIGNEWVDTFNDGSLGSDWSLQGDSSISFAETGGFAKFTKGSGLSSWDYRMIRTSLENPAKIVVDYSFDFRSLSYDGIGELAVLIRANNDQSTAFFVRLRDYQASSTGYEPRIYGYDSAGTKVVDAPYGYQAAQSGSGQITFEWIDSSTIHITIIHPGGSPIERTISGIRSDVSSVDLRGGFHQTYSGPHTHVSFDKITITSTKTVDPTTSLSLGGYVFNTNQPSAGHISEGTQDYQSTLHFSMANQDYAQAVTSISALSDKPVRAEASIYYSQNDDSTGKGHQYAPSLILEYSSGLYTRISIEENNVGYAMPSSLGGNGYNTAPNTWYDVRIDIRNQNDMTGYHFDYYIKASSSNSWTKIGATYDFNQNSLGTLTVILGTPNDFGSGGNVPSDFHIGGLNLEILDDQDGDGLTDAQERTFNNNGIGISMTNPDSDGDGLTDGEELSQDTADTVYSYLTIYQSSGTAVETERNNKYLGLYASNPTSTNSDGDNLNDFQERLQGTNPNVDDTDNDGLKDHDDVAPTIEDNMGPIFEDISGQSFSFDNYGRGYGGLFCHDNYYDHTVNVPSDQGPIYFWYEKYDGGGCINEYVFLVAKVRDDAGVDYVNIKVNGDEFNSATFSATDNYVFKRDYEITLFGGLGSFDFDIYFKDVIENSGETVSFTVDGAARAVLTSISDFVSSGVNWVLDQVSEFFNWIETLGTAALNTANLWLQDKANRLVKFLDDQINRILPLDQLEKIDPVIILNYLANADANLDLAQGLRQVSGIDGVISYFQPLIDFTSQYSEEIEFVSEAFKLISSILTPSILLDLAFVVAGNALTDTIFEDIASNLLGGAIEAGTGLVSSFLADQLNSVGLINNGLLNSFAIPANVVDKLYQDMSSNFGDIMSFVDIIIQAINPTSPSLGLATSAIDTGQLGTLAVFFLAWFSVVIPLVEWLYSNVNDSPDLTAVISMILSTLSVVFSAFSIKMSLAGVKPLTKVSEYNDGSFSKILLDIGAVITGFFGIALGFMSMIEHTGQQFPGTQLIVKNFPNAPSKWGVAATVMSVAAFGLSAVQIYVEYV